MEFSHTPILDQAESRSFTFRVRRTGRIETANAHSYLAIKSKVRRESSFWSRNAMIRSLFRSNKSAIGAVPAFPTASHITFGG